MPLKSGQGFQFMSLQIELQKVRLKARMRVQNFIQRGAGHADHISAFSIGDVTAGAADLKMDFPAAAAERLRNENGARNFFHLYRKYLALGGQRLNHGDGTTRPYAPKLFGPITAGGSTVNGAGGCKTRAA